MGKNQLQGGGIPFLVKLFVFNLTFQLSVCVYFRIWVVFFASVLTVS